MLDGGDTTLHCTHAVEVFIQFVLVNLREFPSKVFRTIEHQIEHLTIERVHFHKLSRLIRFSEKSVEYASRICLGGYWLRRRAEAAVRIVSFVQSLLVLLVCLRHRG